jgi:uncharacterized protein YfaT (DUF1175 family)
LKIRLAASIVAACACLAAGGVLVSAKLHVSAKLRGDKLPPPSIRLDPARIIADGYDAAVLSIETMAAGRPEISLAPAHGARIENISGREGNWTARIRAGIMSGPITVRVDLPGAAAASARLELTLDSRDSAEDGTPDFLRLEDEHDQQAFRRWFTYLAEAQYFQPAAARPAEINDCAALIRYAYREALVAHDGAWGASAQLPLVPAFDSSAKYQYPFTPLGPALFRTKPGSFHAPDLTDGTFLQFADAHTLWRYNSHAVSRDLSRALPGDLLFFRQRSGREPFHSMIYLGPSQIQPDGKRYVLYHTGPDGDDAGEIKRLTIEELMRFPQPEWRPLPSNPAFLGVARWNILRKGAA